MSTVPLVSLESPEQIVASVPHMVGHLPQDSIVVIVLDGRSVKVTARMDAPPLGQHSDAPQLLMQGVIEPVSRRVTISGVIIVGYDERGVAAAREVLASPLLEEAGIDVLDVLAVEGPMWRCLSPHCEGCGGVIDYGDPITAEFVGLGSQGAAIQRSTIEQDMAPNPVALPDADPLDTERAQAGWLAVLTGQAQPDDLAAASACHDPTVRDAFLVAYAGCWPTVVTSSPLDDIDPEVVAWARSLPALPLTEVLTNLLAAAVAGNTAPLWCVYANVAWRTGDGARANIALDRTLEVDSTYRLALLTRMLVDNAMRLDGPTMWDTLPQIGA